MKNTAIKELEKMEETKYDPEKIKKEYKKQWLLNAFSIQSDNDLGNYLVMKTEEILKRELTKEEIKEIKNIIINCEYKKAWSTVEVQKRFGEFNLEKFEKVDLYCPICKKICCTSKYIK